MMNSDLVLDHTRAMAAGLLAQTEPDTRARVQTIYHRCFSRPASPPEVARAAAFLAQAERAYASTEPDAARRAERAWQSLCKALISTNEFIYLD